MTLTGTDRGVGSRNTAAESTYAVAPTSNCTAGARLVLFMAYDNSGTQGADPYSTGPTDTKSNTWTQVPNGAALNDPAAASAGTAMRSWTTTQNGGALTTGDTITVGFGGITTVARAFVLHEITSTAAGSVIETGSVTNATGSSTTPTITTGTVQVGQMVIGAMGSEGNSAITADSDATNGSWSAQQTSGIGTTTSGMQIASQRKIQTTTASTQTYNLTYTSEDWCIFQVVVVESVAISDTETNATSVDVDSSVDAIQTATDDDPASAEDGSVATAVSPSTSMVASAAGGFPGNGSSGGPGGQTAASTGTTLLQGGSGGSGQLGATNNGAAGGGSSAGTALGGNAGQPGQAAGVGGTGGTAPTGGFDGGHGASAPNGADQTGGANGGGGGGGGDSTAGASQSGATGGGGFVRFTYNDGSTTVHQYVASSFVVSGLERPVTGATQVTVECYGAGGGGAAGTAATNSGGGGGGGAYAKTVVSLTGGEAFAFTAGKGGATDVAGDATTVTTSGNDAGAAPDDWFSLAENFTAADSSTSTADAGESLTDALTDDEPATGADAGESLADAINDFESMTSAEAESIFVAIMGNLVTTGSLIMHL